MSEAQTGSMSPQEIVSRVEKKGDTLDPLRRITGRIAPRTALAAGIVASTTAMEALSSDLGLQWLLTQPIYSTVAGTVLGSIYAVRRMREKGQVADAEKLQQEFRDLVGEPVDLIRTQEKSLGGLRRKDGPVVMRWYGLEEEDNDTRNIAGSEVKNRLKGLVEVAELSGIESITMGSDVLRKLLKEDGAEAADLTTYGTIIAEDKFLTETKAITKRISDGYSDDFLLTATIPQCREIIQMLEAPGDVMKRLVDIIRDPGLARLFGRWSASGADADRRRLQSALVQRVLRVAEEREGVTEWRGNRQGGGEKVHQVHQVRGGRIHTQHTGEGEETTIDFSEKSLLRLFGSQVDTTDKLIESVLSPRMTPRHKQAGAVVALYELIRQRNPEEMERAVREGRQGRSGAADKVDTLFQRVAESPQRAGRTGKPDEEDTLFYSHDTSWKKRTLAAGMVIALSGGAAYGTSIAARDAAWNYIYQGASAQADAEGYDWNIIGGGISQEAHNRRTAEIIDRNPLQAIFYHVVDSIQDGHYDLEEGVIAVALDSGISMDVLESLGVPLWQLSNPEWRDDREIKFSQLEEVAEMYTRPESVVTSGTEGILGSNREIYHVEALGEVSPEGYWYTGIYNTLSAGGVFNRNEFSSIEINYKASYGSTSIEVTVPQTPADSEQVLFKVSTPYLDTGSATLPIQSGTKVIAARIVDQIDPTKSLAVQSVSRDSVTGMYQVTYDQNLYDSITLPVLEYYLAEDPEAVLRAHGDMLYRDGKPITAEESAKVKAALGLPPEATDAEVKRAIQAKEYSYTPLTDAGITDISIHLESFADGDRVGVTEAARVFATLPSEICNTAVAAAVVGSGGDGNVATGFRVSADGSMSQQGAHMWRITADGQIDESTPAGHDPRELPVQKPEVERNPADVFREGLLTGGGVLLAGAAAAEVYRRREEIQREITRQIDRYVEKKYFDDGSPRAESLHRALEVVNFVFFSRR